MAESPTSFREDLTHCTSRRKNRSRHISISPNVLPVELCELWARSYEPEKRAEGNSERIIQVVIVRTIFGAVRDIEFFQRRGLSRDYIVEDVSGDIIAPYELQLLQTIVAQTRKDVRICHSIGADEDALEIAAAREVFDEARTGDRHSLWNAQLP